MGASGQTPVLLLTGPPGVGKTTVARLLAARSERAVHLEADVFFRFIQTGYVEPWKPESHEQNGLVMGIVADVAAAYAAAGYFTIVDGIILPRWFLQPVRDSLIRAGHAVAYAVLRAPLTLCVARAQERGVDPLADPEVVERLWRDFADLGPWERNVIEIGTSRASEAADRLARGLHGEQLNSHR